MQKSNQELFENWLKSKENLLTLNDSSDGVKILTRLSLNSDIDFIYSQTNYRSNTIRIGDDLKYSGIYNHLDNQMYDVQYEIRNLCGGWDAVKENSKEEIQDRVKERVREIVDAEILNDR